MTAKFKPNSNLSLTQKYNPLELENLVRAFWEKNQTLKNLAEYRKKHNKKLLGYGKRFEEEMMDISLNVPLEKALDRGWQILAGNFSPEETGLRTELIKKFWPAEKSNES